MVSRTVFSCIVDLEVNVLSCRAKPCPADAVCICVPDLALQSRMWFGLTNGPGAFSR